MDKTPAKKMEPGSVSKSKVNIVRIKRLPLRPVVLVSNSPSGRVRMSGWEKEGEKKRDYSLWELRKRIALTLYVTLVHRV